MDVGRLLRMHPCMVSLSGARRMVEGSRTSAFPSAATIVRSRRKERDAMSTYSQDGFTPDPSTPVYEDISLDAASTQTGTSTQGGGKKDAAKQEAAGVAQDAKQAGKQVAGTAVDQGKQVAGTAKVQAKKVTSEAATQVRGLVGQAQSELRQQASVQQDKAVQGIRTLGEQLHGMASGTVPAEGPALSIVRSVADRADAAANWLQAREPGALLGEVRSFATRRPGTFIAIAAVAGILAGRITTSLVTEAKEAKEAEKAEAAFADQYSTTTSVLPTTNVDSPLAPSPEVQGETAFPPVSAPATGTGLSGGYTPGYEPGAGYEGTEGSRL
jgi:hypothetical protein